MVSTSEAGTAAPHSQMGHNPELGDTEGSSSGSGARGNQRRDRMRGPRRGGRSGRGARGGNRGGQLQGFTNSRPPEPNGERNPHARLVEDVASEEDGKRLAGKDETNMGQGDVDDDAEAELCFICASPVVHNAVSPCNHHTCHICALRLRALYKTKACAHCRTNSDYVVFTDDAAKPYGSFTEEDFAKVDDGIGVKYEKYEIFEDTLLLLRFNCPDPICDVACLGWPDLHRHVKNVHHKVMCDLCTRNKKVFTHEHELFTSAELKKHERFGDDHPGAVDQSGFKGHPECGFCKSRFYGDDELYAHCRDRHERCHLCDRRDAGRQQQYYVNYDSLEAHFRKDHFLCPDQECLDKKFVVFDSEIDLKAHLLEAHPNGLSKDARREARRIDMSGFDYRAQNSGRGNRREGRGGGRGRDPNAEPVPASSAQPLRRDELAFQRQMAIQSAQSISTRTFGGQLSVPASQAAPRPQSSGGRIVQNPTSATTSRSEDVDTGLSSLSRLDLGRDSSSTAERPSAASSAESISPQERARRLRHATVMERALNLLKKDESKFERFRSIVSAYQNSSTSASELIHAFFSMFDTSAKDLGKLINELAEIYESDSKRNGLLKAWNDWKAINDDYPALPGPTGALPSSSSSLLGNGGTRVLRLKSSTAPSSRSPVNKQESWSSQSTNSHPFSSVAAGPSGSSNRAGAREVSATPWTNPSVSSRPSSSPSRPSARPPDSNPTGLASREAFPALPAAARPTSSIFGYGTGVVRRDGGRGPAVNAWGQGGWADATVPSGSGVAELKSDSELSSSKKKGKANKKQMLFHFG